MKTLLLISCIAFVLNASGQIRFNTTQGSGGTKDYRKEHKVWADGSSIIIVNGRESFKFKNGPNPNLIVKAGDMIEVVGRPDSLNRVQFGVYYDKQWVFRIDTVITSNANPIVWQYKVEEDPVYKPKTSETIGLLILGLLKEIL